MLGEKRAALDHLTANLSRRLAPHGVTVNAVAPGIIRTDIHALSGVPERADTAVLTAAVRPSQRRPRIIPNPWIATQVCRPPSAIGAVEEDAVTLQGVPDHR